MKYLLKHSFCNIFHLGDPPKIQPFSAPEHLSEGSFAKLGCVVSNGESPLHFKWYKGNTEIKNDSEFEINSLKDVSFLIVKKLSGYNSGNITCSVRNKYGEDSHSVLLIVKGKLFILNNIVFLKMHNT